jgi:hypothetical protein
MNITFASSSSTAAPALEALAPVGVSKFATIAAGDGIDNTAVYTAATGDKAVYGGTIVFSGGCSAYEVTYTMIDGSDCSVCTAPDVLAKTTTVTRQYPAGTQTAEAPQGYIAKVEVKTGSIVAGAFVAADTASKVDVSFLSERAGLCVEVLVP